MTAGVGAESRRQDAAETGRPRPAGNGGLSD